MHARNRRPQYHSTARLERTPGLLLRVAAATQHNKTPCGAAVLLTVLLHSLQAHMSLLPASGSPNCAAFLPSVLTFHPNWRLLLLPTVPLLLLYCAGFFSSSQMGQLVKLARSKPGQLQSQSFWEEEVPIVVTTILKDVDTKLLKEAAAFLLW
jgi:hypothetical protein